jgi:hypothetical protein
MRPLPLYIYRVLDYRLTIYLHIEILTLFLSIIYLFIYIKRPL